MANGDRAGGERRILVCVAGVPHRSRGASTVLFFHYLEQLKRSGHHLFCLLLLEKSPDARWDVDEFRRELEEPGRCEVTAAEVDWLVRFERVSGALRPGTLAPEIVARAREFRPDVQLSFDIGPLAIVNRLGIPGPRAVWLGDLTFQTIRLHAQYDVRERLAAALQLPKLWLICRRWKAAYQRELAGVDEVIVSSASSAPLLRRLGVRSRYLPYPWPVEKPFRAVARHRVPGARPRFLFCGTLSGLGSRSALHYLLDALYPALVRRWGAGGFEIAITGTRTISDWAAASIQAKPEIEFLGFVDDLYAEMDRCHAAIVPIDVPVGNRSRIVTAMGYGLLVIAHPNTALGNPDLVSEETCLLADDPAAFAAQMARAYEDAGLAERIEVAARKRYEAGFEPRAAGGMLVDVIASLTGASGRARLATAPAAASAAR